QEIQLQPPLVGMLHPQNAVLVFIKPGHQNPLKAGHDLLPLPGLDKDQYSILWVEHTDKGRLELNFLIPNTELLTGKRLQPY
ncbi:relaxase/mobilization nuclease domain-containing protein, partial [Klebsiella pneumoniae]